MHEDTGADNAQSVIDEMTIEVAKRTLDTEIHQKLPTEQAFEVPCGTSTVQMLKPSFLETITSVEDVVLVEDASDDEEAILDARVTIKDPILLVTIEDSSTQSTVEVMVGELRLLEDPLIEEVSSPAMKRPDPEDRC
jgi:exosome complex RNA-binding protein Rrp42 (RNase PH superfamily)